MLSDASGYPSDRQRGRPRELTVYSWFLSGGVPAVTQFIAYLFGSWARQRQLHPELVELVPGDLFERGRGFAARLAAESSATVVLHGDLTPVNVLDGGDRRGPGRHRSRPCLGDPAYDAIDLLVWQAGDIATIEARAAVLATAIEVDVARLRTGA